MTYRAPLADIGFALKYAAGLPAAIDEGLFGDLTMDDVDAVLTEAGRFATEVLAPLNRVGDTYGTQFKDGVVTTAPGWKEAYNGWREGGWNAVAATRRMGRTSPAADAQHGVPGNVERRRAGVFPRPAADHRGC